MTSIPFSLRYSNISHGKSTICKWVSYWKREMSIAMLDYRSAYQLDCRIDEDSIFAVHRMGHRVPFSQQLTLKHFSELRVWKCSRRVPASRVQSLLRNRPLMQGSSFCLATHRELLYLRSWLSTWGLCLFLMIHCLHSLAHLSALNLCNHRFELQASQLSLQRCCEGFNWWNQHQGGDHVLAVSARHGAKPVDSILNTKRAKVFEGIPKFSPEKKTGEPHLQYIYQPAQGLVFTHLDPTSSLKTYMFPEKIMLGRWNFPLGIPSRSLTVRPWK